MRIPLKKHELNYTQIEKHVFSMVKELKQFDNAFEQLKKDIANWVNGELSAVQSRMTTLYEQNECVHVNVGDIGHSEPN